MSSWRSSNVDEMVRVTFAEKGSLPSKEEGHWRVPSVVGLVVAHCGLPLAAGAPCSDIIVGVAADDDGVVPRCPAGGAVVRVAADDDGVVPGCPGGGANVRVAANDDGVVPRCLGGGAPQSPVWCSTLQMTTPSRILRSGGTLPMESVVRWPQ